MFGPARSVRRILTLVVVAFATILGLAAPATAATYAHGGRIGPHWAATLECRNRIYGTTSILAVTASAPAIYATNFRAGAGNDGAYVRYRAFLVNSRTGGVVMSSGFSGYSWALDNRPAAFTGAPVTLTGDWRSSYVVDYRIEWWHAGGRAPYAWAALRADRYQYVASNNVAGGVWQGCVKYL